MKSDKKLNYDHKAIEKKWRERWLKEDVFTADTETTKEKFYNLWMFPYPSGEGLHAGHAFASTGSDVFGKYMRMNGYEVFQPIGYDSFGIHSENYALKRGEHPNELTEKTTENYQRQLQSLGHGYDWSRTLATHTPEYYKWTQWLFTELFKAGLAYRKKAEVNWCSSCKTVLADEQVIEGKCERCGTEVERKALEQWFFRITDYAERLLSNLEKIDWPEKIVTAQRNWIGKKTGATVAFSLPQFQFPITVFTTRPDTIFGATFLVLAPEHELLPALMEKVTNKDAVEKYLASVKEKSDEDRVDQSREKTGVALEGVNAINPATGREIPVWVGDYVLGQFGTGAIMAVPGHDVRDFEFALKFNLPVKRVIKPVGLTHYKSYVMGGNAAVEEGLRSLGAVCHKTESGSIKVELPVASLEKYRAFIKEALLPGFWNEVVGDEVWFVFKEKNGELKEFILDSSNQAEIAQLCSQFNGDPIEKTSNIYAYLGANEWYRDVLVWEGNEGRVFDSNFLNDQFVMEAQQTIIDHMQREGWGKDKVNYHLRDWLISRQRYWGPPIPMVYCVTCAGKKQSYFTKEKPERVMREDQSDWEHWGWYPVSENQLPVELPYLTDYKPQGNGRGPLADHADFIKTVCPACGSDARRETDVSDTFLDSAWYFLRYPSVRADSAAKLAFDEKITQKWLPVDLYFGGAEHSVLHLMYARFVTQFLNDQGYLTFDEPFPKFFAHGLMIKDGAKMSKSKGNVVNPDAYIEKYGADTLRMYLMFMGPMDGSPDFRDSGIIGMKRWLDRVIKLTEHGLKIDSSSRDALVQLHILIKGVTEDTSRFKYNTAVAKMMIFVNWWQDHQDQVGRDVVKVLVLLLAPFVPYLCEELYSQIAQLKENDGVWSRQYSVHLQPWPEFDSAYLIVENLEIPVQINGKLKLRLSVPKEVAGNEVEMEAFVLNSSEIKSIVENRSLKRVVVVPERLVNIVL